MMDCANAGFIVHSLLINSCPLPRGYPGGKDGGGCMPLYSHPVKFKGPIGCCVPVAAAAAANLGCNSGCIKPGLKRSVLGLDIEQNRLLWSFLVT